MVPTWGPPGSCGPQIDPRWAPWTLLSGVCLFCVSSGWIRCTNGHKCKVSTISLLLAESRSSTNSSSPDSKVHGANMGPISGRQDSCGPHVGPMNLAIWEAIQCNAMRFRLWYFSCPSFIRHNFPMCLITFPERNFRFDEIFHHTDTCSTWWRHQMETFSALLALCAGNSPVPVNSPHKGQWRGALMFTLICARINDWVNNREAGDLRRHLDHYDVIVMKDRW